MKKIPSLFISDENHKATREVNPLCQWVIDGEGVPTAKLDGTSCMVKNGKLYKRYDNSRLKEKDNRVQKTEPLDDWIHCECETERGRFLYWVPVGPKDYYHQIGWAWAQGLLVDGTYELVGPEVQGNPHGYLHNVFIKHGRKSLNGDCLSYCQKCHDPRNFDDIKRHLETSIYEGIVWHHPDGRMAKITKSKFGIPWGGR